MLLARPEADSRSGPAWGEEHAGQQSFRHEMLEYGDGAAGFVGKTLPLITKALAAGAPVLVAARHERLAALGEALGEDAERVEFRDMRHLGANPARIIPAWRRFLTHQPDAPGPAPLGVGEPAWPGRRAEELEECRRSEQLLNLAFGGGADWRLVCPYDLDGLDDCVIEHARSSHPYLTGGERDDEPNFAYRAARASHELLEGALAAPGCKVRELDFDGRGLAHVRGAVASWAAAERLGHAHADELVLAVDELATNSIRYGGGRGTLWMWRAADRLLCEVRDAGCIEDALVGRIHPPAERTCGRGLWIVNQVCDLVQIRSSASGTSIRVQKLLGT